MTDAGGWPRLEPTDRFPALGPRHGAVAASPVPRESVDDLAADLRDAVVASGQVAGVTTCDLHSFPYPAAAALAGVARSPAPLVRLTSRFLVVQWSEPRRRGRSKARRRTLLWGIGDPSARSSTGLAGRAARLPGLDRLTTSTYGSHLGHLRALGIDPEDVDLVAADHLQGVDPRPLLGTVRPAPDLGAPDEPLRGAFPNATLVTHAREWTALSDLHPFQAPWYRPEVFRDLDPARVALVEGDVTLGPGIALIATHGHTAGSSSLVLHTGDQLWVSSSNAVAAECYVPRASRIPGLRHHAVTTGHEVVLHANSPDRAGDHHDAMLLERSIADPAADAPVPRCFPLSELTAARFAPGLSPTHPRVAIAAGTVRGSSVTTLTAA